ncbi:MAG: hypothetical protein J7M29_09115 [Verrucomicrobia bacterium]|nr:hypothetical protein [Verrucomicrobiota bacterium]
MKHRFWTTLCAAALFAATAAESKSKADMPERSVVVAFQYPSVKLTPEDTVSADLLVKNRGKKDETVLLEVAGKPKDWTVEIKRYGTVIGGIFVGSGEDATLTVSARPKDKNVKRLPPGEYRITVNGWTEDGVIQQRTSLTVRVEQEKSGPAKVTIETSYPVLEGASDEQFQFSLDVRNDTDQDAVFNFRAAAPEGWQTSFKPAYESKQISSLKIEANSSKTIEFEVKPPYKAKAGEYVFKVTVEGPKAKAEKELKVVLTGTYELKVGTPTGLLSVVTERGKEANVTILVQNTGSAPQREITFTALKPENWKVEFKPEKLENLKPDEVKQVEAVITPAEKALVGDYSVDVQIQGEKANEDLEFRVTVKASSAWGWVGVGIIILVVIGMGVTFRVLGRR